MKISVLFDNIKTILGFVLGVLFLLFMATGFIMGAIETLSSKTRTSSEPYCTDDYRYCELIEQEREYNSWR